MKHILFIVQFNKNNLTHYDYLITAYIYSLLHNMKLSQNDIGYYQLIAFDQIFHIACESSFCPLHFYFHKSVLGWFVYQYVQL